MVNEPLKIIFCCFLVIFMIGLISALISFVTLNFRGIYSFKYKKQDYIMLLEMLMQEVLYFYKDRTDTDHIKEVLYHLHLNSSGKYSFTYYLTDLKKYSNMFNLALWLGKTNPNDMILFNIMYKDMLNDMPLYINHEDAIVRVISNWRLKIGK